jgi:hypothetical protein
LVDFRTIAACNLRWKAEVDAGGARAEAATREAVLGCRQALVEITRQLSDLKYPVSQTILPSGADLGEQIAKIKTKTGSDIPEPVVRFWQSIGGVSLIDGKDYAHTEFWKAQGITAEFCDGLVIDGCTTEWVSFVLGEFEDWQHQAADGRGDFVMYLAPDGYHKDNISGGAPYGVLLGENWVPTWQNFRWSNKRPESASSDNVDLIEYLRISVLECAGFPGLHGDEAFEPIRKHLLENVVAF